MDHVTTMKRSKSYREASRKIEKRIYSLEEAVKAVVEAANAKFDESVEMHARLNIEPKKGDQQVRVSITLPHGTGKTAKVAVITTSAEEDAKKAGADLVGGEEVIEDIKSGKFFDTGYDVLVATPEMMPKLAPVARILGPKGMMPNPKADTVTTKIADVVTSLKKGKIQFKNDNTGNVHQVVGRISMGADKVGENARAFLDALKKAKPTAVKGKFIVSANVCSTMGPSIVIDAQ